LNLISIGLFFAPRRSVYFDDFFNKHHVLYASVAVGTSNSSPPRIIPSADNEFSIAFKSVGAAVPHCVPQPPGASYGGFPMEVSTQLLLVLATETFAVNGNTRERIRRNIKKIVNCLKKLVCIN
jgi:hypothetical protein